MRHLLEVVAAAAAAAATMYYFDPDMGPRRRAELARRLRAMNEAPQQDRPAWHEDAAGATELDDGQLRDHVTSGLGTLVSHPGAIHVEVDAGSVRLSGDVLASELDGVLTRVRDMAGVKRVINAMTAHRDSQAMTRSAAAAGDESLARARPT